MRIQLGNFPVPDVRLLHSRDKALRLMDGTEGFELKDAPAQTWSRGHEFVVLLEANNLPIDQEAGLLAHEAYHVARAFFESIGEYAPGEEIEAYMVQCVFQGLFKAQRKWRMDKSLLNINATYVSAS